MSINLKIITPDGIMFDNTADLVIIRTISGNVGIYGEHSNYFSIIETGLCTIEHDGKKKYAAVNDGFISVDAENHVKIVLTTFEWADKINLERTIEAEENVLALLKGIDKTDKDYTHLRKKLQRAENRKEIALQFGELKNA